MQGLGRQIPVHPRQAHQEDQAVEMFRQQHRVAQEQGRWGVENHQVVAGQLPDRLHHGAAALRAQQLAGIWRRRPRREQIQPGRHLVHHPSQRQLGISEQAGEALPVVGPHIHVEPGTAHVRIHQQHPLAQLGQGLGEKRRGGGLPLPLGGGGERHQPNRLVGPQQAEIGEQVAQRFLDRKPLAPFQGRQRLADRGAFPPRHVGHHPQQGGGQAVAQFLRVMEHMVEPVAQERQAHPRQPPQKGRKQQIARHARLHRPAPKAGGGQHAPGHRALGHLQPKILPRLDVRREVVAGHLQLLLQGFVLLDLGGVGLKAGRQALLLAPDLRQLRLVFVEVGPHLLQLTSQQQGPHLGHFRPQLHHLGSRSGVNRLGFGQLPLQVSQITGQVDG